MRGRRPRAWCSPGPSCWPPWRRLADRICPPGPGDHPHHTQHHNQHRHPRKQHHIILTSIQRAAAPAAPAHPPHRRHPARHPRHRRHAALALAAPAAPAVPAAAVAVAGPGPAPGLVTRYVVQPGDSLSGIAARFGIQGGWPPLYASNLKVIGWDPGVLHPGAVLVLPGPARARYTITAGDTLSGIAAGLGIAGGWPALYAANRQVIGSNPGALQPGTVLRLPRPAAAHPSGVTPPSPHPAPPPPRAPAPGPGKHHRHPVTAAAVRRRRGCRRG